ncbi:hypothetical protein ACFXAW_34150 [Streptomyces sp. NPDC059445]|uniref:hypothetical protein n=1 Tax=Streptomyces sp. NPDC059445 TaxID=3346832 RepID=UPI0036CD1984
MIRGTDLIRTGDPAEVDAAFDRGAAVKAELRLYVRAVAGRRRAGAVRWGCRAAFLGRAPTFRPSRV